jgi:hypothetical protein
VLNTVGSIVYAYGKYFENIEKEIHKHVHEQSVEIHTKDLRIPNETAVINKDDPSENPAELIAIKVQS